MFDGKFGKNGEFMKEKSMILLLLTFAVTLTSMMKVIGVTDSTENTNLSFSKDPPVEPWLISGKGEKVNVSAGDHAQIRTMSKNHIRLRVNESVQLQINESDENPVGPLLNRTRTVNRFMHITMNGTCALNATLFRNYTNQELVGLGNVSTFRWAWFNETNFQWEYAHQNWVEKTSDGATIYCNTTHFSVWTILTPELEIQKNPTPGTPFNSQNGTGFAIYAGNMYQIRTQSGFALELKLNQSAEVKITEYEKSPNKMTQTHHKIRTQTMAVELNTTKVQIQANFSYIFTNQIKNQLGIQNMEKLKFIFYNESSEKWEAPKHQWLEGEVLHCNTTHFSLWTITEEVIEDVSDTTDSIPGFSILFLFFGVIPVLLLRIKRRS